jgi:hypothetical protein
VWASDATLSRESFDALASTLQRGGLIRRIAPYERVCDDRAAREIAASSHGTQT